MIERLFGPLWIASLGFLFYVSENGEVLCPVANEQGFVTLVKSVDYKAEVEISTNAPVTWITLKKGDSQIGKIGVNS